MVAPLQLSRMNGMNGGGRKTNEPFFLTLPFGIGIYVSYTDAHFKRLRAAWKGWSLERELYIYSKLYHAIVFIIVCADEVRRCGD